MRSRGFAYLPSRRRIAPGVCPAAGHLFGGIAAGSYLRLSDEKLAGLLNTLAHQAAVSFGSDLLYFLP
jgi:hypothetical protein